ncbi:MULTISPECIES: hypothetical protein [unclassified Variovorax]|uniref:hypothetical protein n=1 Tax=unclassified Variovorax TaxID=663243 RepID=UPI003F471AFA
MNNQRSAVFAAFVSVHKMSGSRRSSRGAFRHCEDAAPLLLNVLPKLRKHDVAI